MLKESGHVSMGDPLAFFITWTTYGSWLPGDERGWVAKPGEFRMPAPRLEKISRELMTEPELTLDVEHRVIVEDTIADHCRIRGWRLHIVAARMQHVHVVVTASGCDPDDVLDQFKAWCTRKLKERERRLRPGAKVRKNWWTQRGSRRRLYDDASLDAAICYVRDEQGEPTPRPKDDQIEA